MNYKTEPKKLSDFLLEAHKNTYANENAERVRSTRLGSKDLHFEKGDLVYHDTYFGNRDFIGEEVIYIKEKPIWSMNYYGFITLPEFDTKEVYTFLKKALRQEYNTQQLVRGLKEYSHNDWQYLNNIEGDISSFKGEESILFSGKEAYRGYYHGGFIE